MLTIVLLLIVIGLCGVIICAHQKHTDALAVINAEIARVRRLIAPTKPSSVAPMKPTVPPDKAA
jgi:hypothetical protein